MVKTLLCLFKRKVKTYKQPCLKYDSANTTNKYIPHLQCVLTRRRILHNWPTFNCPNKSRHRAYLTELPFLDRQPNLFDYLSCPEKKTNQFECSKCIKHQKLLLEIMKFKIIQKTFLADVKCDSLRSQNCTMTQNLKLCILKMTFNFQ